MKKLLKAIVVGGTKEKEVTVKLGVIGADTDVWDDVKDRLKDEGINLEYVQFSDYNQPNAALADGSIDINSFQHQFFLDNYNKEFGTDLVSIGNTVNAPLGIYSDKVMKQQARRRPFRISLKTIKS